jgi:hypothetical protein
VAEVPQGSCLPSSRLCREVELQDDILQPQYQLLFRDEVVELASRTPAKGLRLRVTWLDGNGIINGGREDGVVALRLRISAGVHRLQRRSAVVVKTS